MKSINIASAIALVVAFIAGGLPAHAADTKFPAVPGAPSWYPTAPEAPYARADTTTGDQYSVQEDDEWHAAAWWYGPEGGAPGVAEPDIIIETLPKPAGEVGATDPNLIALSLNAAFPELTESLSTAFTRGVAVPIGGDAATPKMTFPGDGIILAQRPPRDCTVTNDMKDPDRFIVNIAMLGENQHKYLVNLTVEFGTRTWNNACTSSRSEESDKEQPTPEATAAPVHKVDEIKKAAEAEIADAEAGGANTGKDVGTLLGVIGAVVIGLAVLWFLMFRRKRTHNNDGTRKQGASRADELSDTPTVRSRHGSRW